MPITRVHNAKFFVCIVESPSLTDAVLGRSEGRLIQHAAELNQVPCALHTVSTLNMFHMGLVAGVLEQVLRHPDRIPIIHISAHGYSDGIVLTDNTQISWSALRSLLTTVNSAFKGALLLCMSSCKGMGASVMAMHPESADFPYYACVGTPHEPTWPETAVAYACFYHHLAAGARVEDAVVAMRAASGHDGFQSWTSESVKTLAVRFRDALAQMPAVVRSLASLADRAQPGTSDAIKGRLAEKTAAF